MSRSRARASPTAERRRQVIRAASRHRLLAHPTAKRFDERQVRRRRFVFVASSVQDHGSIDRGLNDQLAREASLAGAGLAAQQQTVAASFSSAPPKLASFGQLVRASDEASA